VSAWHWGVLHCHLRSSAFTSPIICNYYYLYVRTGRCSRDAVVSLRSRSKRRCVSCLVLPAATSLLNTSISFFVCVCVCLHACFRLQVHLPCSLPRSGAPGLPAEWKINGLPRSTWHLRSILQQRSGNRSRVRVITAFSCQLCNEVWSACLTRLLRNNVSLRHGQQSWISHPARWFCSMFGLSYTWLLPAASLLLQLVFS